MVQELLVAGADGQVDDVWGGKGRDGRGGHDDGDEVLLEVHDDGVWCL